MRRVLRAQRGVAWIAAGPADGGHPQEHCLVRVAARELEASETGVHTGLCRVGGSAYERWVCFGPNFVHGLYLYRLGSIFSRHEKTGNVRFHDCVLLGCAMIVFDQSSNAGHFMDPDFYYCDNSMQNLSFTCFGRS